MADMVEKFFETARERYLIWDRRRLGYLPPFTADPVFSEWRFCNVHREHDKTTVWFRENVRDKVDGWDAVRACVAFRWFNRIEVGERIKDVLIEGWDRRAVMDALASVRPVVTGAFMVKTPPDVDKLTGVVDCVDAALARLAPRWEDWGSSLEDAWRDLMLAPYMGSFMAYEVVSDLRWTKVLWNAQDVFTWAAAGPGAARGLSRVFYGDDPAQLRYTRAGDQVRLQGFMRDLLAKSKEHWPADWRQWEMREVEHWACEFDKYCRAEAGEPLKRRFQVRSV